jgi:poly-gamma-glutamate system protein
MFRPSLRTNVSLILLSVVAIVILVVINMSNGSLYETQVAAGERMQRSIDKISTQYQKLIKEDKATWDKKHDPNKLGLIGPEVSPIITSRGVVSEKKRAINPNLPAVFVKWFNDAKLEKGDYVAVGLSGASPAINVALYSAMKELELKPVIITALSSSRYGASNINLTWLDMEKAIYSETGFKSLCASRGGNRDVAAGLNSEGKELLVDIITKDNKLQLIEGADSRIKMYKKALPKGKEYKAFVNIGGAVANVGSVVSANLLKEGVNKKVPELEKAGVLEYFASNEVPVIHLFKGNDTFNKYYFAQANEEADELGKGIIYGYNQTVALVGLIVLLIAIALVVIFDRKDRHFMSNIVAHNED